MTKASNLPPAMTVDELRALPAVMDLETAAAALRITYPMARRMVSEEKFPLVPLPHSGRYRVYALSDLLNYLGLGGLLAAPPVSGTAA